MSRPDPDDARFEELMAREFPEGLVPSERRRVRDEPPEPSVDEPAPGLRSWTPPEEPQEPFVPPPAEPARRWTSAGIAGTALVALPLLMVLLTALGVRPPLLVSVLAGGGLLVGVGLLLHRLRRRPPTEGDGAVL